MIKYRIADSADAENLLKTRYTAVVNNRTSIYNEATLLAWAPQINEETIAAEAEAQKNPDRITIVAEADSNDGCKMAGLGTIVVSEGSITQFYVVPEFNGKGIGHELMSRMEAIARKNGVKLLKISSSKIAVESQKKRGFIPLNTYEYDLGNGLSVTCVMMEKPLE